MVPGRKEVNKHMTLAERMIEYRAKNNLSQRELAEKVGVSTQSINSYENGTQDPSKVTVAKIELVVGKDKDNGAIDH